MLAVFGGVQQGGSRVGAGVAPLSGLDWPKANVTRMPHHMPESNVHRRQQPRCGSPRLFAFGSSFHGCSRHPRPHLTLKTVSEDKNKEVGCAFEAGNLNPSPRPFSGFLSVRISVAQTLTHLQLKSQSVKQPRDIQEPTEQHQTVQFQTTSPLFILRCCVRS